MLYKITVIAMWAAETQIETMVRVAINSYQQLE